MNFVKKIKKMKSDLKVILEHKTAHPELLDLILDKKMEMCF